MIARCNPFRGERIDRIAYRNPLLSSPFKRGRDSDTIPILLWRLRELNYRAAIIGLEGSGKTTLLEELAPELCSYGYHIRKIFLNKNGELRVTTAGGQDAGGTIVLFDGADLLKEYDWLAFEGNTHGGLIITSHREGMLPTLIQCSTSLQLLEEIVQDLTGAAKDFPLETLFRQHNGNLRDVLRALYDLCANEPAYLSLGS